MTVSVRVGKLRLKFFFSLGFALFIAKRAAKRRNKAAGEIFRDRRLKKTLKEYKKQNGSLVLAEIEKEGLRVEVRL